MRNWTDEQKKAINLRNCNLLVSAAAGSGKTAVLVQRIIEIILKDNIDIDKLLIVTFTNAAAGEMRDRIASELYKQLDNTSNGDYVRHQLNILNKSSISTIHSFCINVIREQFQIIGIDPNFRIGDDTETDILKLEASDKVLENEYDNGDTDFADLVDRYGGERKDTFLSDMIIRIYEFIQSKPYPIEWLNEKINDFNVKYDDFKSSSVYKAVIELIESELTGASELLSRALKTCSMPNGPLAYEDTINHDIAMIEKLQDLTGDLDIFYRSLSQAQFQNLKRCGKDTDQGLKDDVKSLRDDAKEIVNNIKNQILQKSPEDYIKDLNELFPCMKSLLKLIELFLTEYTELKNERGIIDFNDLEHYALKILSHKEIADQYRDKYRYIFIDEYQDSNIVQETILNYIKRDDNLFLVGDVKQSIYRFRLADPSLFMDKYHSYASKGNGLNCMIDLNKNFRSSESIINAINYIFKNIMSERLGEIEYGKNSALYIGSEDQKHNEIPVEFDIINRQRYAGDSIWDEYSNAETEAKFISDKIKKLVNTEIFDNKKAKLRKVEYRDIVILIRSTKSIAPILAERFDTDNVPYYADINTGYFDTVEVKVFMDLLRLIDNIRQDIPLLSVMRSVIGGFNADDMIKIRMSCKKPSFYDAVVEYIENNDDELKDRLCSFFSNIANWKEESKYMPVCDLMWKIFMDTGYLYYVSSLPGGKERQANLTILLDRAKRFEDTSIKGLFNFLRFIDKLKTSSGDMGAAKTLGENDNVVRIMSIHKSKGLEFPIVIIASLGRKMNFRDSNDKILLHKDLGIGPKYIDPKIRQCTDTISKIAMKSRIRIESMSEEMRILYVAMTRAEYELILVGTVNGTDKAVPKWKGNITPYMLSRAQTYFDWLCPVLMRHSNGSALRELAGMTDECTIQDDSKWDINIVNTDEMIKDETSKESNKKVLSDRLLNPDLFEIKNEEKYDDLKERLDYKYPYNLSVGIPAKLTVTDINKLYVQNADNSSKLGMNIPALVDKPKFMQKKVNISAAEKGTLVHFIMQHIDLKYVRNIEMIKEQLYKMSGNELITEKDIESIDAGKILKFYQSSIGKRILASKNVYREVPFNYLKKAGDIIDTYKDCDESFLIQGVIDCYFEENDELVLVDYKTDHLTKEGISDIADKYRLQLELYEDALCHITNKKVKEKIIYLFSIDMEVSI